MTDGLSTIASLLSFVDRADRIPVGGVALRGRLRCVYAADRVQSDGTYVRRVYFLFADASGTVSMSVDVKAEVPNSPARRSQQEASGQLLVDMLGVDQEYVVEFSAAQLGWLVAVRDNQEVIQRGSSAGFYVALCDSRVLWPCMGQISGGQIFPDCTHPTFGVPAPGSDLPLYPLPDYCALGQKLILENEVEAFSCVARVLAVVAVPATGSPSVRSPGSGAGRIPQQALFRMTVADTAGQTCTINIFPNYPRAIIRGCEQGEWSPGDIVVMLSLIQRGKWVNMGGATRFVKITADVFECMRGQLSDAVAGFICGRAAVEATVAHAVPQVSRYAHLVTAALADRASSSGTGVSPIVIGAGTIVAGAGRAYAGTECTAPTGYSSKRDLAASFEVVEGEDVGGGKLKKMKKHRKEGQN